MGSSSEKPLLPPPSPVQEQPKTSKTKRNILTILSLFLIARTLVVPALSWGTSADLDASRGSCEQAEAIVPGDFDPSPLVLGNEGRIREWLGGAVRVPTESEWTSRVS
jgi:Gly-Xaa carboxypeptidase